MRRTLWTVTAGVAVVVLAGCTATAPDRTSTPSGVTVTAMSPVASATNSSSTTTAPSATDTAPVVTGPTTTADGACPFLTLDQALDDVGERLGRVTVSTSGGGPVGCTFYPATGALASSEHLPPPTVPVIAVTTTRYADVTAAHNAMVRSSEVDPSAYSDPTAGVDEAIAFATVFYRADGDQDRAYTFRKGTTLVLVRVAQESSFSAKHVGTDVAAAMR